jgi:hypothetical protein
MSHRVLLRRDLNRIQDRAYHDQIVERNVAYERRDFTRHRRRHDVRVALAVFTLADVVNLRREEMLDDCAAPGRIYDRTIRKPTYDREAGLSQSSHDTFFLCRCRRITVGELFCG